MNEIANKYIKRIRIIFIIFGILGYLYTLTFGMMLYLMDVSSKTSEKNLVILALLAISTFFLILSAFVKKRSKFIWIILVILSAIILINGLGLTVNHFVDSFKYSKGTFIGTLFATFLGFIISPSMIIELIIGAILIKIFLKSEVKKYYFEKEGP
jgi:hypothetical protein